ncbi:MAG: alpha/beta fold hydrolase [Candidatus Melainabacteria bacterium]|nr:MAG: alpha/beta fold hydrolase [Candidatus Melainabacteria bacterium]
MLKYKTVQRLVWGLLLGLSASTTWSAAALADSLPAPRRHAFVASDRTRLMAEIYSAPGDKAHPCVILVHQLGRTNADMKPLVAPLVAEGFTVVNLDMRGHGASQSRLTGGNFPYTKFTNADWQQLPFDLRVVLKNMVTVPNIDVQKFALVGASIGANASIIQARLASNVEAVVMLSPGVDFHGLKPAESMAGYHKPVLLVAAKDDTYSAESATQLSKMNKKSSLDILPQGGHGSQMFAAHPELAKQIATWLHKAMSK